MDSGVCGIRAGGGGRMAANRGTRAASCLLVMLLIAAEARAQAGDWNAVQSLKIGTRISIKITPQKRTYVCYLRSVSADELTCRIRKPIFMPGPSTMTFARGDIREVRLRRYPERGEHIGAGIGALAGAAIGAARVPAARGLGAAIGAGLGALLGMPLGAIFSIFARDKLVYRQPDPISLDPKPPQAVSLPPEQ